ncbi:Cytochrome c oxidase copper chaperone [Entomophthora muscae]|uniref:Cytochrome c oxidase copper chaperone n=1 Tax=Entomophthora muscae TaxID=34485 RepID=A0ACC2SPZ3_9FUNG|nr:Cytochrome c oxidase copper chaperone [Entomophthora muscae]
MSNKATASKPVTSEPAAKDERPKPCCACPATKKARDECIFANGEESCLELIAAHKKCMRDLGFNI